MKKRCTKCKIEKDLDEFPIRPSGKDGHRNCCKKCYAEAHHQYHLAHWKYAEKKPPGKWSKLNPDLTPEDHKAHKKELRDKSKDRYNKAKREWRKNNKEKNAIQMKKDSLKRMYGLSLEKLDEMIVSQENKCPICQQQFDERAHKYHVDHDHTTGRVRAVLCVQCNLGLGRFCDNTDSLKRAIDYINFHSNIGDQS
jgi:hypothetical protein